MSLFFLLLSLWTPAFGHSATTDRNASDEIPHSSEQDVLAIHLAARRAWMVATLRAYAHAGLFPLNTTTPGLQSQLLDATGNPCGMAHLMIADGHTDLVWELARRDNAMELGAQRRGPVHEWILRSGLTHEEVAFVQEPDFFLRINAATLRGEAPVISEEFVLEQSRLRAHFLLAAAQIGLLVPR